MADPASVKGLDIQPSYRKWVQNERTLSNLHRYVGEKIIAMSVNRDEVYGARGKTLGDMPTNFSRPMQTLLSMFLYVVEYTARMAARLEGDGKLLPPIPEPGVGNVNAGERGMRGDYANMDGGDADDMDELSDLSLSEDVVLGGTEREQRHRSHMEVDLSRFGGRGTGEDDDDDDDRSLMDEVTDMVMRNVERLESGEGVGGGEAGDGGRNDNNNDDDADNDNPYDFGIDNVADGIGMRQFERNFFSLADRAAEFDEEEGAPFEEHSKRRDMHGHKHVRLFVEFVMKDKNEMAIADITFFVIFARQQVEEIANKVLEDCIKENDRALHANDSLEYTTKDRKDKKKGRGGGGGGNSNNNWGFGGSGGGGGGGGFSSMYRRKEGYGRGGGGGGDSTKLNIFALKPEERYKMISHREQWVSLCKQYYKSSYFDDDNINDRATSAYVKLSSSACPAAFCNVFSLVIPAIRRGGMPYFPLSVIRSEDHLPEQSMLEDLELRDPETGVVTKHKSIRYMRVYRVPDEGDGVQASHENTKYLLIFPRPDFVVEMVSSEMQPRSIFAKAIPDVALKQKIPFFEVYSFMPYYLGRGSDALSEEDLREAEKEEVEYHVSDNLLNDVMMQFESMTVGGGGGDDVGENVDERVARTETGDNPRSGKRAARDHRSVMEQWKRETAMVFAGTPNADQQNERLATLVSESKVGCALLDKVSEDHGAMWQLGRAHLDRFKTPVTDDAYIARMANFAAYNRWKQFDTMTPLQNVAHVMSMVDENRERLTRYSVDEFEQQLKMLQKLMVAHTATATTAEALLRRASRSKGGAGGGGDDDDMFRAQQKRKTNMLNELRVWLGDKNDDEHIHANSLNRLDGDRLDIRENRPLRTTFLRFDGSEAMQSISSCAGATRVPSDYEGEDETPKITQLAARTMLLSLENYQRKRYAQTCRNENDDMPKATRAIAAYREKERLYAKLYKLNHKDMCAGTPGDFSLTPFDWFMVRYVRDLRDVHDFHPGNMMPALLFGVAAFNTNDTQNDLHFNGVLVSESGGLGKSRLLEWIYSADGRCMMIPGTAMFRSMSTAKADAVDEPHGYNNHVLQLQHELQPMQIDKNNLEVASMMKNYLTSMVIEVVEFFRREDGKRVQRMTKYVRVGATLNATNLVVENVMDKAMATRYSFFRYSENQKAMRMATVKMNEMIKTTFQNLDTKKMHRREEWRQMFALHHELMQLAHIYGVPKPDSSYVVMLMCMLETEMRHEGHDAGSMRFIARVTMIAEVLCVWDVLVRMYKLRSSGIPGASAVKFSDIRHYGDHLFINKKHTLMALFWLRYELRPPAVTATMYALRVKWEEKKLVAPSVTYKRKVDMQRFPTGGPTNMTATNPVTGASVAARDFVGGMPMQNVSSTRTAFTDANGNPPVDAAAPMQLPTTRELHRKLMMNNFSDRDVSTLKEAFDWSWLRIELGHATSYFGGLRALATTLRNILENENMYTPNEESIFQVLKKLGSAQVTSHPYFLRSANATTGALEIVEYSDDEPELLMHTQYQAMGQTPSLVTCDAVRRMTSDDEENMINDGDAGAGAGGAGTRFRKRKREHTSQIYMDVHAHRLLGALSTDGDEGLIRVLKKVYNKMNEHPDKVLTSPNTDFPSVMNAVTLGPQLTEEGRAMGIKVPYFKPLYKCTPDELRYTKYLSTRRVMTLPVIDFDQVVGSVMMDNDEAETVVGDAVKQMMSVTRQTTGTGTQNVISMMQQGRGRHKWFMDGVLQVGNMLYLFCDLEHFAMQLFYRRVYKSRYAVKTEYVEQTAAMSTSGSVPHLVPWREKNARGCYFMGMRRNTADDEMREFHKHLKKAEEQIARGGVATSEFGGSSAARIENNDVFQARRGVEEALREEQSFRKNVKAHKDAMIDVMNQAVEARRTLGITSAKYLGTLLKLYDDYDFKPSMFTVVVSVCELWRRGMLTEHEIAREEKRGGGGGGDGVHEPLFSDRQCLVFVWDHWVFVEDPSLAWLRNVYNFKMNFAHTFVQRLIAKARSPFQATEPAADVKLYPANRLPSDYVSEFDYLNAATKEKADELVRRRREYVSGVKEQMQQEYKKQNALSERAGDALVNVYERSNDAMEIAGAVDDLVAIDARNKARPSDGTLLLAQRKKSVARFRATSVTSSDDSARSRKKGKGKKGKGKGKGKKKSRTIAFRGD